MPLSDADGSKARPEDPPSTGVASPPPVSFAATANAEPTFSNLELIGSKEHLSQTQPIPRTRSNTGVSQSAAAILPVSSQAVAGGGREMSIGIEMQVDTTGQPARVFLHTMVTREPPLPQPQPATSAPPSGTQTPTERPPAYNELPFYNWMESTDGTVGKLIGTVQTHFGPCGGLHLLLGAVCAAMETLGFVQYMWTSCAGWGVAGATFFILEGLLSLLVACTRPLDKCAMKMCIMTCFCALIAALAMIVVEFNHWATFSSWRNGSSTILFHAYRVLVAFVELLVLSHQTYIYSYYYNKARSFTGGRTVEYYGNGGLELGLDEPIRPHGVVVEVTPQGYRMEHPEYDAPPAYNLANSPAANMSHTGPVPVESGAFTLGPPASAPNGPAAAFAVSHT